MNQKNNNHKQIVLARRILAVSISSLLASYLTGCGMSAGQVCVGTTGFLREHNRARITDGVETIDRGGAVSNDEPRTLVRAK